MTNLTDTTSIKPGTLVAANASPGAPLFAVLPAFYLDDDSRSPELSQAGWRLAESHAGTGQRILVRPGSRSYNLTAWDGARVVSVEARDIETGAIETETGFAIVARLGDKRRPFITREDNLTASA